MSRRSSTDDSQAQLARILDAYLAALEQGERPDREQIISRYPEIAEALRDALVSLEFVTHARGISTTLPAASRQACGDQAVSRELLGDYQIIREIGRGGMGIVYEANQMSLGRRVALKVLPFVSVLDSRQLARFRNEAQAAAILTHKNIVPVYAVGCERGVHFFAMQYIEGQSLAELVQDLQTTRAEPTHREPDPVVNLNRSRKTLVHSAEHAALPDPDAAAAQPDTLATGLLSTERGVSRAVVWHQAASIIIQACEALDHAHRQGIVHRDIKPANLMLDASGHLWVTDFGLARIENALSLTVSGDLLGTLRYMSPEQALAKRPLIDHRSDIYSLGATLFELLTLQPAVKGKNREEVIQEIAFGESRPARKVNPAIPVELDTIAGKAMARDPADRYQTARQMEEDLRRFLDDRPILARPPGRWRRTAKWMRRHKVFVGTALAGLAVSLLVALAILGYSNYQIGSERQAALKSEQMRSHQLVETLVQRASALRQTESAGRRQQALQAINRARDLASGLDLPEITTRKLRDEAIACLAITDLRQTAFWRVPKVSRAGFDSRLTRFAIADWQNRIHVRNMINPEQQIQLDCDSTGPWTISVFSPDDRFLAAIDQRERCTVWNLESGSVVFQVDTSRGAIDFTPDSSRLCCGTPDGRLVLMDLESGREIRRLRPARPQALCVGPAGQLVAICHYGTNEVVIRDLDTGDVVQTLDGHVGQTGDVAWSPDRTRIAVGCLDSRIYIWDLARMKIQSMMHHPRQVTRVRFSPDGRLLASSGHDANTRLWQVSDGRLLVRSAGLFAQFDRSGQRLAFQTAQGVGTWSLESDPSLQTFFSRQTPDGILLAKFDPLGQLMVSAGIDGAGIWDRTTGRELAWLPLADCGSVAFDSEGRFLYTASRTGLYRWPVSRDASTTGIDLGPPVWIADLPVYSPKISLSGNDRFIAFPDSQRSIRVQDLHHMDQAPIWLEGHENLHYVELSDDLRWAATCARPGNDVVIWDLDSGARVATLAGVHDNAPAFSPDGKWLVTVTTTEYRVFETGTWKHLQTIPLECPRLGAVAFSRVANLLAVSQGPGKVVLLETGHIRPLATLEVPDETTVSWLSFDRTSTRLAIASVDQFQIWDLGRLALELKKLDLGMPPELQISDRQTTGQPLPVSHIRVHMGDPDDRRNHPAWRFNRDHDSHQSRLVRRLTGWLSACGIPAPDLQRWFRFFGYPLER